MSSILQRICDERRADVAAAKQKRPLEQLRAAAAELAPTRSLKKAIATRRAAGARAVIAEIKRASPSKGPIHPHVDVAVQAAAYVGGGAAGISVLTEPRHFWGSDEDLQAVRRVAPETPILRKDFTVDPYQIWEARLLGADVVLLLVNVLGAQTRHFLDEAKAAGMEALVEVHNEAELEIAIAAQADIIGINARNLNTFETRLEWVEAIIGRVPASVLAVAESGIATREDLERLQRAGAAAFLIGEALMRQPNPAAALAAWGAAV